MIRLFTQSELNENVPVILTDNQHHYLAHVMRCRRGDDILLFNGKDGEWIGQITDISKKQTQVLVKENTRLQSQEALSDVWLCFAAIKKDNMDFVIQKATELGVSVLQPVLTHRTVVSHINTEKMRMQAVEAAEQSERLSVPLIKEPISLDKLLDNWDDTRTLYYLDERGAGQAFKAKEKVAYLVGPEGGFDTAEFEKMRLLKYAEPLHFGRRILRAETAAVTVLSVDVFLRGWK